MNREHRSFSIHCFRFPTGPAMPSRAAPCACWACAVRLGRICLCFL